MPADEECVCCLTIDNTKEKAKTQQKSCIVDHPGFDPVCLNAYVLETAYYQYRQQYGDRDEDDENARKEMKFDEMNILATHHPEDKDYGHMKIDEPPTPYSKYSDQEDEDGEGIPRRGSFGENTDLDPESVASRLENIEHPRIRRVSTQEESSSEEEEELTEEQVEVKRRFDQKRKMHYNEFQAVKLAKQLMEEEDEDDEDDDDDDKKVGDVHEKSEESSTKNIVQMQTDDVDPPVVSGSTASSQKQPSETLSAEHKTESFESEKSSSDSAKPQQVKRETLIL